jgi:hypothetical protein
VDRPLTERLPGDMLATRATLGGRLCTVQEAKSTNRSALEEQKKSAERALTATTMAPAAGASVGGSRSKEQTATVRTVTSQTTALERVTTQGGNALLASR